MLLGYILLIMLFPELPIAFPWYQRKEHQNRYKANVAGGFDIQGGYKPIDLLCPFDALLRFQFYLQSPINTGILPTAWGIYKESDDSLVQTVNLSGLSNIYLPGVDRKYFYHDGRQQNFHLTTGAYYSRIDFPNGFKEYSEVFHVCNFSVLDSNCPFLKLQWWNDSDIDPIFYNDKVNGRPRFTNVVYLDTFIHEYEPIITQETANDQDGKPIPTFTLAVVNYKIIVIVPAYLDKALTFAEMHDHIFLTTAGLEHRTGELDKYTTSSEKIFNSAFSNITVSYSDTYLVKKACGENMF